MRGKNQLLLAKGNPNQCICVWHVWHLYLDFFWTFVNYIHAPSLPFIISMVQLDLSHAGLVDAIFRIIHQPWTGEKKSKRNLNNWLLACTPPWWSWTCLNLGLNFAGPTVDFFPVWCCFPNSKGTESFWVLLILIFCTLCFYVFGGHKNMESWKIMYWMTFISFIFYFPRDLNNARAKQRHEHKVSWKEKNKGYYCHPINNYYFTVTFLSFFIEM